MSTSGIPLPFSRGGLKGMGGGADRWEAGLQSDRYNTVIKCVLVQELAFIYFLFLLFLLLLFVVCVIYW